MKQHQVKGGDTLQKIAARYYGDWNRWPEIYEANKPEMDAAFELARPTLERLTGHEIFESSDYLRAGQVLSIPQRPGNPYPRSSTNGN